MKNGRGSGSGEIGCVNDETNSFHLHTKISLCSFPLTNKLPAQFPIFVFQNNQRSPSHLCHHQTSFPVTLSQEEQPNRSLSPVYSMASENMSSSDDVGSQYRICSFIEAKYRQEQDWNLDPRKGVSDNDDIDDEDNTRVEYPTKP